MALKASLHTLQVIYTPGHAADHVCLLTADGEWLHDQDGVAFCRAQVTDEHGSLVAQAAVPC